MPRLEASLLQMPELVYEGELKCMEAVAVNEGSGPLRGVRIACLEEHTLLGAAAVVLRSGASKHEQHRVQQARARRRLSMRASSPLLSSRHPFDPLRLPVAAKGPAWGLHATRDTRAGPRGLDPGGGLVAPLQCRDPYTEAQLVL